MILWLASYPKSGNTWLRTIIHQIIVKKKDISDEKWLSNIHKLVDTYPRIHHFKNLNSSFVTQESFQDRKKIIKNWNNSQKKINLNSKLHFLKTHSMLCSINIDNQKFNFTNKNNTLGAIYIVRDPRNVITSLKNYLSLASYKETLDVMIDKNMWGGVRENEIPHLLSSWDTNVNSWMLFPKNFILFKYEDFLCDTKNQIKRLIKYLQKFIKIQLSEEIIDQIIKDTSFENLKNLEKKGYFLENSKKKTKFFYLGPQNDYTKFLDKKIQYKIEERFEITMKKLKYLQ
jgi:hypothetical protein